MISKVHLIHELNHESSATVCVNFNDTLGDKNITYSILKGIITQFPECVAIKDEDGKLPLHLAVDKDYITFEMIKLIVDTYPEGLKVVDNSGNLPLFIACYRNRSYDVIKYLVEKYPESIKHKDSLGRLPMHIICNCVGFTSNQAIVYLASLYPDSLKIQDNKGLLPIHAACIKVAKVDIIKSLVNMYPECLMKGTSSNALPIHRACWYGAPVEIISFLASACTESLTSVSNGGDLPLHIILSNVTGLNLITLCQLISRLSFEAVLAKDKTDFSALDISLVKGSIPAFVYRILLNNTIRHIDKPSHIENFRNMNWKARSNLIITMALIPKSKYAVPACPILESLCRIDYGLYSKEATQKETKQKRALVNFSSDVSREFIFLSTVLGFL